LRVLSCVGARPQFVKAAVLSVELERRGIEELLVHTGQHYDVSMSDVFFKELSLPKPAYELGVGSGGHGAQSGEMMRRLEPIAIETSPDWMLVYGDTNSTLAGALVAAKLGIPVAHVEAGLRSFNRAMPEEINRIVADHVSELLFVPNARAAEQLAREGIVDGVRVVGDLMVDLATKMAAAVPEFPEVLDRFRVMPQNYAVATVHRASNTDDAATFARLIDGLRGCGLPVVFPVHPRTRAMASAAGAGENDNIIVTEPLSYSDMIALMARARVVFTDSGGLQKEAYVLRVPCVTLREETEWVETLEDGWNVLVGSDPTAIAASCRRRLPSTHGEPYGSGDAAALIAGALLGEADGNAAQTVEFAGKRSG
jgi:UDP-N-acetylglucosamine 2-epimerase